MKKSEARAKYKELRAALTQRALNVKQDLLLIKFQEISLPYAQIVHTYVPKYASNEPDPGPLVDWMRLEILDSKYLIPRLTLLILVCSIFCMKMKWFFRKIHLVYQSL